MSSHTVRCKQCDREPESGTHKGDDVLRCPGCERILVRGPVL